MAEQRLIDANNLGIGMAFQSEFSPNYFAIGWNSALKAVIEVSPTIDPETLPIVHHLREELAKVTAERDTAIADLKTICDCDYCANDCVSAEESICEFCEVESCSCRGCIKGENWTWRGQQKGEGR